MRTGKGSLGIGLVLSGVLLGLGPVLAARADETSEEPATRTRDQRVDAHEHDHTE